MELRKDIILRYHTERLIYVRSRSARQRIASIVKNLKSENLDLIYIQRGLPDRSFFTFLIEVGRVIGAEDEVLDALENGVKIRNGWSNLRQNKIIGSIIASLPEEKINTIFSDFTRGTAISVTTSYGEPYTPLKFVVDRGKLPEDKEERSRVILNTKLFLSHLRKVDNFKRVFTIDLYPLYQNYDGEDGEACNINNYSHYYSYLKMSIQMFNNDFNEAKGLK